MYEKVSTNLNFVEREKKVEQFWKDNDIFRKSMENRKEGPTYTFYDGPPTANGKPHIGHVLTRVIKVVLYEEGLDNQIMSESIHHIANADLLIIGGTSLVVYPAAGMIRYFRGDKLVLLNKSTTSADEHATLCIRDSIGQVLKQIKVN